MLSTKVRNCFGEASLPLDILFGASLKGFPDWKKWKWFSNVSYQEGFVYFGQFIQFQARNFKLREEI
jgi:hypothetical protein